MNEQYTLELSKKDIISILRGLSREADAQRDMMVSFEAMGYKSGVFYCNRFMRRADKLTQRLLNLPDIEDGYTEAQNNDVGREPAFVQMVMDMYVERPSGAKNDFEVKAKSNKEEIER